MTCDPRINYLNATVTKIGHIARGQLGIVGSGYGRNLRVGMVDRLSHRTAMGRELGEHPSGSTIKSKNSIAKILCEYTLRSGEQILSAPARSQNFNSVKNLRFRDRGRA
jgi:hypothetical protein